MRGSIRHPGRGCQQEGRDGGKGGDPPACGVAERGRRKAHIYQGPVPSLTAQLQASSDLAQEFPLASLAEFFLPVHRIIGWGLAQNLLLTPAEHALGGRAPRGDLAIPIMAMMASGDTWIIARRVPLDPRSGSSMCFAFIRFQ